MNLDPFQETSIQSQAATGRVATIIELSIQDLLDRHADRLTIIKECDAL